jgi:enoyl-CoA hydratase/carnithine racemase
VTSSSYKTLNVTGGPDGHVVTVEFNRPDSLNAMNTAMGEDLLPLHSTPCQWLNKTARQPVVLTGVGAPKGLLQWGRLPYCSRSGQEQ